MAVKTRRKPATGALYSVLPPHNGCELPLCRLSSAIFALSAVFGGSLEPWQRYVCQSSATVPFSGENTFEIAVFSPPLCEVRVLLLLSGGWVAAVRASVSAVGTTSASGRCVIPSVSVSFCSSVSSFFCVCPCVSVCVCVGSLPVSTMPHRRQWCQQLAHTHILLPPHTSSTPHPCTFRPSVALPATPPAPVAGTSNGSCGGAHNRRRVVDSRC